MTLKMDGACPYQPGDRILSPVEGPWGPQSFMGEATVFAIAQRQLGPITRFYVLCDQVIELPAWWHAYQPPGPRP